jgi:hypothetical protein
VIHAGSVVSSAASYKGLQEALRTATQHMGLAYLSLEASKACALPNRHVESHNAASDRYLRARSEQCLWLFSQPITDPSAGLGDQQHYRLAIAPGSGHLGYLICHRYLDEVGSVPTAADVRQYFAEPLSEVLVRLSNVVSSGTPIRGGAHEPANVATETDAQ